MNNLEKKIQNIVNLYKLKRLSEAETLGKILIYSYPKVYFLHNLLGLIMYEQKKFIEAVNFYKSGLKIKPNYAMIYNNLGMLYKDTHNYTESEKNYKKSIEIDNSLPEAHNNLGNLYVEQNKQEAAIKTYQNSIQANSEFYIAHFNLGITYKSMGNFEKAKEYLLESIKIFPKFFSAHRALSQVTKYTNKEKHFDTLKKLSKDKNIQESDKAEIFFSLGKAYEDLKNFSESFEYFYKGNKIRNKSIYFSIDLEKKNFSSIKNTFNKKILTSFKKISNSSIKPIFIVGMPRSGTTLVEQIISSHPDVFGGDELNYFNESIKNIFCKSGKFNFDLSDKKKIKQLKLIGNDYINKINLLSKNSKFITDKLPINFKWIGFIKLIFPNAKIVHCVRNPKDTCLSIYKNFFTNNELNYGYDLNHLVEFYKLYENLMEHWNKIFINSIIEVNYENLVLNSNYEIKNLIKSCNLSWSNSCLNFYKNKRVIKTASDTQVREKIYNTSISNWKNYHDETSKYFKKL